MVMTICLCHTSTSFLNPTVWGTISRKSEKKTLKSTWKVKHSNQHEKWTNQQFSSPIAVYHRSGLNLNLYFSLNLFDWSENRWIGTFALNRSLNAPIGWNPCHKLWHNVSLEVCLSRATFLFVSHVLQFLHLKCYITFFLSAPGNKSC